MKYLSIFVLFLSLTVVVGCGNGFIPFGGKVTFEEDGSPLTVGTVVFTTDTFQAEGAIHPDGTYTLGSLSAKDGLPAGTYKVLLSGAGIYENEKFISSIDPVYADRTTTPLSCEVGSGTRAFDFMVKKPSEKK